MNDVRPIAVFDSGVGGISVLKELVALMPEENYLYFGDSANAPYGSRPADEVRRLATANVERLIGMGAKAVVIACNTATSVAAEELRRAHVGYPIIGVEPALKPAVLDGEHPTVAVLGTPITIHEEKFRNLMEHYRDRATILPIACDKLAYYVEHGVLEGEELEDYIASLFIPLEGKKPDSVVLGCTHYPFVRETIRKVLGDDVRLFDGGLGTAKETRRRIEAIGARKTDGEKGTVRFMSSNDSEEERAFYTFLFSL